MDHGLLEHATAPTTEKLPRWLKPVREGLADAHRTRSTHFSEKGHNAFKVLLRELMMQPMLEFSQFAAALAFLAAFDPHEVIELLQIRAATLESRINVDDVGLKSLSYDAPQSRPLTSDYMLAMHRAELEWIRKLISETRNSMSRSARRPKSSAPSLGSSEENTRE